ncbi:MAG: hypothetical protein K0S86_3157, partial [Geminicoccaceae bacterium]|nr:hypothetical protein [Geminicoccaceae bacterium]
MGADLTETAGSSGGIRSRESESALGVGDSERESGTESGTPFGTGRPGWPFPLRFRLPAHRGVNAEPSPV